MSSKKKWLPIENNCYLLNKYVNGLGMDPSYQYTDVFGFDEELLNFIPQPVLAVMLCYPITNENEKKRKEETEEIEKNGQQISKDIYYMDQTIGNACGTIGIIHSILNNLDRLKLQQGFFTDFYEKTKEMTSKERASFLEVDEKIEEVHQETAKDPNSVQIEGSEKTNIHFICYVHKDGHLYELDGRRKYPLNRGKSSQDTLLKDAIKIIQNYMNMNPEDMNFSVTCLAKVE